MSENAKPNIAFVECSDGQVRVAERRIPWLGIMGSGESFRRWWRASLSFLISLYLWPWDLESETSVSLQIWSRFFPWPSPQTGSIARCFVTSLHWCLNKVFNVQQLDFYPLWLAGWCRGKNVGHRFESCLLYLHAVQYWASYFNFIGFLVLISLVCLNKQLR